jgi:hypothetical protein
MLSTVNKEKPGDQNRLARVDLKEASGLEKTNGDAKRARLSTTKKRTPRMRSSRKPKPSTGLVKKAGGATVEQKLAKGEPIESLRLHSFDAEPIRIRMVIPASKRRDAVAQSIVASLASNRAVNLHKPFKGKRRDRDRARSKGFFFEGGTGKNFSGANSRQILVRVPVSALDTLVRDLGQGKQGIESIELAAGQLVYRGVSNIRSTLSLLDGQSKAQSRTADALPARSRKERDHVAARSTATHDSNAKVFSFLRKLSVALAESKTEVGNEKKAAKVDGIVGPPAPPDVSVATVASAAKPAPAAIDTRFVTLVVELRSDKPAAPRKAATSKPPSAAKAKSVIDRKKGADKSVQ